jgi:hypothetical protein
MRTTRKTRRTVVGSVSLLASLGLVVSPVSAAQAASTGHVVTVISVPMNTYAPITTGLGSVWLASNDESSFGTVVQIDPRTNRFVRSTTLDIAPGGFTVGYGSLWVSGWATNTVERIDPATMRVITRIPTRLGPENLIAAFGSIWVSDHHNHSVSRIDPATDKIVASPTVGIPNAFRDGPANLASDSRFVYVGVPNSGSIYRIDPRTNRADGSVPTPSYFCGDMAASHGTVWWADPCSDGLTSTNLVTHAAYAFGYDPGVVTDDVMRDGTLWVSYDKSFDPDTGAAIEGSLDARDPTTGALLGTVSVGGDVSTLGSGFGSLWTFDPGVGKVTRVAVSG